jgi:hypothetical protein
MISNVEQVHRRTPTAVTFSKKELGRPLIIFASNTPLPICGRKQSCGQSALLPVIRRGKPANAWLALLGERLVKIEWRFSLIVFATPSWKFSGSDSVRRAREAFQLLSRAISVSIVVPLGRGGQPEVESGSVERFVKEFRIRIATGLTKSN